MSESLTFKNFNPTSNEHVTFIKAKTDELIAYLDGTGGDPRRTALAKTAYEEAAMWAVKAQFSDKPPA
jgi:hypothetical protein